MSPQRIAEIIKEQDQENVNVCRVLWYSGQFRWKMFSYASQVVESLKEIGYEVTLVSPHSNRTDIYIK